MRTFVASAIIAAAIPATGYPYDVYDSHNHLVGELLGNYEVALTNGGTIYSLSLYKSSEWADAGMYFKSGNCTGLPYIQSQTPNELMLLTPAYYLATSLN